MKNETKRERYQKLLGTLKTERDSSWRPHWQDLADYFLPRRVRWNNSADRQRAGDKRNQKIINNRGTIALRTLKAGMMGGITSPSRPWKRLSTSDSDLADFGSVKEWLSIVDNRMNLILAKSNFYNVLPTLYGDLACFGTGAIAILEDGPDVIRCYGFPIGSYVLATSPRGIVDTFIREFTMTVRQVVMAFGQFDPKTGKPLWNNFSQYVRHCWERGDYEQPVEVCHAIMPNVDADPRYMGAKFKPWSSCYFENAAQQMDDNRERFLRESGFDQFPILAPRWDLASPDDVYGSPCPGMEALGDTKALQLLEKRKAQAIEKGYNPPLKGPSSLKTVKISALPGDITYEDTREGMQGLAPIYQVQPDIQGLLLDIEAHEERISDAFLERLFMMIANDDRAQRATAEEIRAARSEQLQQAGPVLEHLNDELLDPGIDLIFHYMLQRGEVPPPPPELEGQELKVEYISVMAQAQKMVATSSMDGFLNRVSTIATTDPSVLDKVDFDQTVDEYAEMMGVPPRIVRPDEDVAAIREQRAQAQKQAQAMVAAEQAANVGKTMADTDTAGKNALTDAKGAMKRQGAQGG